MKISIDFNKITNKPSRKLEKKGAEEHQTKPKTKKWKEKKKEKAMKISIDNKQAKLKFEKW